MKSISEIQCAVSSDKMKPEKLSVNNIVKSNAFLE